MYCIYFKIIYFYIFIPQFRYKDIGIYLNGSARSSYVHILQYIAMCAIYS